MNNPELRANLDQYVAKHRLSLHDFLGDGTDGCVWRSSRNTAIKALERHRSYVTERDCYRLLTKHCVTAIDGFSIPKLVEYDDHTLVIEMAIVSPPCVIDFAKSYIGHEPEYPEEVLEEREQHWSEIWEDRWPQVQAILWKLRQFGIHYVDPSQNNIKFGTDRF